MGRRAPRRQDRPMYRHPYPPIEDYALISDCESTVLVCADDSIDWCCMPTHADAALAARRAIDGG
jgi:hypothetical protein